jgi:hypothetical protein
MAKTGNILSRMGGKTPTISCHRVETPMMINKVPDSEDWGHDLVEKTDHFSFLQVRTPYLLRGLYTVSIQFVK